MRLGLVLDQVLFEHEGRYSTDEAFIRFVEAMAAPTFNHIEFCSRVRAADADLPYVLDPSTITVRALPWYSNVASLCLHGPVLLPRIARLLDAWMPQWDMVMASGVHPLSALALTLGRRRGMPTQLWVRGNLAADVTSKYRGAARVVARAVARVATAAIPDGTPIVSIGHAAYPFVSRMGDIHVAFDSKFGEEDIRPGARSAPAEGRPWRLLYVGRISAEKGLEVLVTALEDLAARPGAHDWTLTIAGADFVGSSYGERFRSRLAQSAIAPRVTMAGYVPYGPALFGLYDAHDALVLPSFTEGFPQVLLEAMARALPIVATNVGAVSAVVHDGGNGLLVSPGDPAALAGAIDRLFRDQTLWLRCSREGLATAARYTRQAQVASIATFTAACLRQAPARTTHRARVQEGR